jgi:hypothetical protein
VGQYWVLRFPKDVLVLPGAFGGQVPDYPFAREGDMESNHTIILELNPATLQPYGASTTLEERLAGKMIEVRVSAGQDDVKYLLGLDNETIAKFCQEVGRVEPDVIAYIPKAGSKSDEGSCFGSREPNGGSVNYMVYDKAKNFLIKVDCLLPENSNPTKPAVGESICHGFLNFKGGRPVQLSWSVNNFDPAVLQLWMLKISTLLERATVHEENVPPNLEYKP